MRLILDCDEEGIQVLCKAILQTYQGGVTFTTNSKKTNKESEK